MGEKAKRQPRGPKLGNPSVVAEESRRMSGVGIAKSAKPLVIAADECRAEDRAWSWPRLR
jgi:hypothetical protein